LKNLARIDESAESERRALNRSEIARLFAVAPDWRRLAYAVAIASGLRLSELRRLDCSDLDVENSRLRLRWRQTKNRKPAYGYLPTSVTATLAAFADSGAPRRLYDKARTRRALPEGPLMFIPTHLLRVLNSGPTRQW
jgi:integrase